MTWIPRVWQLSQSQRWLLCKTYVLLTLIRMGLWLLPFERLYKYLGKLSHLQSLHGSDNQYLSRYKQSIASVTWAIDASARRMPGTVKCLARALAAKVLLDRCGCASELKIGVAKNDVAQLEAHAWVEVENCVIIGRIHDLARFKILLALPKL